MTSWWSQARITATVNQNYIEQELGSKRHQDTLHRVLAFGDGLTDDTYLDWILERSPRFFLVLNDIGIPEKIFEVIDRSFDDDDLPLSQDALWELNLFGTTSETLDKKFHRQQFYYLIQELEPGGHIDYGLWDIVPIEPAIRKPSIPAAIQSSDRVATHGHFYTRKRIPTLGENGIDRIRFIMHLKQIVALQHRHLVTVWATYSQNEFNYVLLKPSCDLTLRHILEEKDQAKQFKGLEKHERRQLLITWVHCLTSALAYLHSRGFMHRSIRPSTISIDHNNVIYLSDYNALKMLDVDESPNPYSGEIYDYAPPENWQRKPTLHETAPLKTVLESGGRTRRKLPKTAQAEPESRRPSVGGEDSIQRTHSRSQNSSSGSSTNNGRPRNALITTFAPPETTPALLPGRFFPGDVFSLTAVNLTILSYLLGHTPKSFASHRCRVNRQAGRGNAPPDASFHKNLSQVEKWIVLLAKEAGQKEKKDQQMWGSVVELVNLCKDGLNKEPEARIKADEYDKKMLGWVDFGIGRRRKCECSEEDLSFEESENPHPVITAQRISILSWSKISERISSGLCSDETPSEPGVRPRRSLSKRLTLDRAPELRRPRYSRPSSSMSRPTPSIDEPLSPTSTETRHSEKIRSAVRHAVQPVSMQHARKPSNPNAPTIVHQGRSAYRLKPKKVAPISTGRRNTHPIQRSHHTIREESAGDLRNELNGDLADNEGPTADEPTSSYTLKPRRRTHPMPSSFPHPPYTVPQASVPPTPTSAEPPTPTSSNAPVIHGIAVFDEDDDTSTIYGRDGRLTRHESFAGTEIWGLGNALEEEDVDEEPVKRAPSGRVGEEEKKSRITRINWPLPARPHHQMRRMQAA